MPDIHDWKRLKIYIPGHFDRSVDAHLNQLSGGLRSLIALYPDKNEHFVTTCCGLYRCIWDNLNDYWYITVVANAGKANISDTFLPEQ